MILVGGGARSGKSSAALHLLEAAGPRQAFIATARPSDDEMRERIAHHRAERSPSITTFEEPFQVAGRILREQHHFDAILVDCLTLWLSNHLLAGHDLPAACRQLVDAAAQSAAQVILVTNEVGCGIVPDHPLGRRFRDEAGRLNQLAAQHAREVHWMIFGIALKIK